MSKQTPKKIKEKVIKLPISKFIDSKFRDYAVYVLESRGIPSFYDALTPVQRYILKNSPSSFQKTLSVVGKSIEDGYHHGNASLESSIARLARPFGNALQILEGYGFFGSEVRPSPAAARYTSVRISPTVNGILNKYSYLTTRNPDGAYDPFWIDVPIGLTIPIVGIAVGYKTTLLPRKLKDIQEFLEGKRKSVKPYFEGFTGTIEKYKAAERAWLISSSLKIEDKKITINEIPPILKYSSVIKKFDYLINKFESNIRIKNDSKNNVDITVIYSGKSNTEWEEIVKYVKKSFSIIVTETPVFVKDGTVLTYDSVEEYLEDYKWQLVRLKYKNNEYERNKLSFELKFNIAKELFIKFMLEKKRTNDEIDTWVKPYDKEIAERLERLTSRKFTTDELVFTKQTIINLTKDLKDKEKELKDNKKEFESYADPTIARGISSKRSSINLFETEDVSMAEDIAVWTGEDIYEEEKVQEVIDEDE